MSKKKVEKQEASNMNDLNDLLNNNAFFADVVASLLMDDSDPISKAIDQALYVAATWHPDYKAWQFNAENTNEFDAEFHDGFYGAVAAARDRLGTAIKHRFGSGFKVPTHKQRVAECYRK